VEGHLKEEAFIYLKVEFQTVKISCNNIMYIEGLKDYAKIHLDSTEKSMLSLIALKALEEKLPKGKFMRIHKSFIVALVKISSITKNQFSLVSQCALFRINLGRNLTSLLVIGNDCY
jgi:two-component system response regulator LytT